VNSPLSLSFLIAALILIGLAVTSLQIFKNTNFELQRKYWTISLGFSVLAYLCFLIGVELPLDSFDTNIVLYLGNNLFIVAAVFQTFFCLSLTQSLNKKWLIGLAIVLALFPIVFYQYRLSGNFIERSLLVAGVLGFTYSIQLHELFKYRDQQKSPLLVLLSFTNLGELVITIIRMMLLVGAHLTAAVSLKDLPGYLVLITSVQVGLSVLSYIVGAGYWVERISSQNAKVSKENRAIQELLEEKNELIYSLIATRKIAESGALAATIAHEINQPLGVVQLNAQYLQTVLNKKIEDPLVDKLLLNIVNDNKRAAEIVKTLRSLFTSIDRQLTKISIDEIIRSLESVFYPKARDLNIVFKERLDAPVEITVNSGEVQQVLMNLINNAFDVLEKEESAVREIKITTQQVQDTVVLTFEDSGPGVPEDMQASLFDLMKSDKSTGMGVGLWLSKYIVEHHQGTIRYIPKNGPGAMFVIQLPIEPKVSKEDIQTLMS
jgi:signal transduction histidine kinase